MKAVILAGGEGARLRPLTLGRPKALFPLFEGTILSHCLEGLRRSGITDVTLALGYQAGQIEEWCAGHALEGMSLHFHRETQPLGAAGAVHALLSELGSEDFLVLPGDVVWDFDLKELVACHQAGRYAATAALCRREDLPEYASRTGHMERHPKKAAWEQSPLRTVNTGIYMLTRRAMEFLPAEGRRDFIHDLFPALMARGEAVGSYVIHGYWRDIDSPERYLDCAAELLSGKGGAVPPAPRLAPGIWSQIPIPAGVQVVPPCWFAEGVTLGEGSLVGPHVALGRGVAVGRRALVQRSVLMEGARVGDRATLYGSILAPGAVAGRGSVLNEGSVLADRARAGEDSILAERVAVWPGRETPPGVSLTVSLSSEREKTGLRFGDGGVLRGTVGEELTPESFTTLGVILGAEGKAALGWAGGDGAAMLARALGAGLSAGGGAVLAHDGCCPAAGAWLGEYYAVPASLFVEQSGSRIFLHWFDSRGLPPGPERISQVEQQLNACGGVRVEAGRVGQWDRLTGINAAYAADAARRVCGGISNAPVTLSVPGEGAWDQTLAALLERTGCRVLRHMAAGVPAFASAHGGFWLETWQEDGAPVDSGRLLALTALLELEKGNPAAVPASAPAVVEALGARLGAPVFRLGRDRGAEDIYAKTPWFRDALFAAGYLACAMGAENTSLTALLARLPRFTVRSREISLHRGRSAVMDAFTSQFRRAEPAGKGVRLNTGMGWVYVTPLIRRPAVRLLTEGADAETAEELCGFYENEIRRLDRGL